MEINVKRKGAKVTKYIFHSLWTNNGVDFKVVTRDNYESFLLLASNFVYNLPRQNAAAASTMPTRLKYALHLHFYNLLTISDVTDFKQIFLSFHPHLIAIGAL